jgi:hypothetical protein
MIDIQLLYNKLIDNHYDDALIFHFIKTNNISYTKNNNGHFFNLNTFTENQLKALYDIINNNTQINNNYNIKIDNIKKIVNIPISIKKVMPKKYISIPKINNENEIKILTLSMFY